MKILTPQFVERYVGDTTAPALEEEHGGVADDPEVTGYVAGIGARLVRENGRRPDFPHAFKVLVSKKIVNAFAIGNGGVYVTRGILSELRDESELAYILGHEIGHVGRRHIAVQLDVMLGGYAILGIGQLLAYGATGKAEGDLTKRDVRAARDVMLGLVTAGYSRDMEYQADHDGVRAAMLAGYDPWGAVRVMRRFAAQEEDEGLGYYFRSHPYATDRVKRMTEQIETNWGPEGSREAVRNEEAYATWSDPEKAAEARRDLWIKIGAGTAAAVGVAAAGYALLGG